MTDEVPIEVWHIYAYGLDREHTDAILNAVTQLYDKSVKHCGGDIGRTHLLQRKPMTEDDSGVSLALRASPCR